MIIKLAILLAVVLIVAAFATWAFLPARHLPGNRARHLRIRLHLRLHPGKGFTHLFSLWLRWSRFAVLRRSGRIRRSLPLRYRLLDPGEHSVFLGRAHYRHGLRVPLEEHVLVMAPPRTFKTAFLGDVIIEYPGPVIATSTKPDVYGLTSAVRAQLGPVHVFNPQHIGGVASTFCWDPVAGCEDPATAIRRADAFAFACRRRASRTARSGPPKPVITYAATSTPPRWPAMTCAPWPPGSRAPTRTSPNGSWPPPALTSGRPPWPSSAARRTRPPPPSAW